MDGDLFRARLSITRWVALIGAFAAPALSTRDF
jgi:hypothetical protein